MCCNWLTGTPHNGMPSILFVFFFRTRLTTAQLIGQTKKPTLRQLEKPFWWPRNQAIYILGSVLHEGVSRDEGREYPQMDTAELRGCVSTRSDCWWNITGLPQRLEILGSYFFRVDRYRWDEEEIQLYLVVGTNTTTTKIHFHLVYLVTFPSITGI